MPANNSATTSMPKKHSANRSEAISKKVKLETFKNSQLETKQSVINASSSFAVTEAYKTARTNLMFLRKDEGCQIVAVTSPFQSEGKTTNCINLSITLAQAGLRTLMIDADLRRPMADKLLGDRSTEGLSDYLACMTLAKSVSEAMSLVKKTEYDNLFLLPAGHIPPNPAELLSSKRMCQLLEGLSEKFDYIMIDTPPVYVVTDATVLKNYVHGYLLVARAGHTSKEGLLECIARMKQVDANIFGILLNDVDQKSSYKKYDYKYKKYGHYYKYGHYSDNCGYCNPTQWVDDIQKENND